MARSQPLRVFIGDATIRAPDVPDTASSRYASLMALLGILKELAEGHGSSRLTQDGYTYWEARLGEHEWHAMRNWISWHASCEIVGSMAELFVLPVDTGAGK